MKKYFLFSVILMNLFSIFCYSQYTGSQYLFFIKEENGDSLFCQVNLGMSYEEEKVNVELIKICKTEAMIQSIEKPYLKLRYFKKVTHAIYYCNEYKKMVTLTEYHHHDPKWDTKPSGLLYLTSPDPKKEDIRNDPLEMKILKIACEYKARIINQK